MPDRIMLAAACLACWPCWGQAESGPSQAAPSQAAPSEAALDDAVRLGTVATLAPLCGMRDEAWSFDLRRTAVMDATRPRSPTTRRCGASRAETWRWRRCRMPKPRRSKRSPKRPRPTPAAPWRTIRSWCGRTGPCRRSDGSKRARSPAANTVPQGAEQFPRARGRRNAAGRAGWHRPKARQAWRQPCRVRAPLPACPLLRPPRRWRLGERFHHLDQAERVANRHGTVAVVMRPSSSQRSWLSRTGDAYAIAGGAKP